MPTAIALLYAALTDENSRNEQRNITFEATRVHGNHEYGTQQFWFITLKRRGKQYFGNPLEK